MSVLQNCRPERVFHYFEEMCAIPHGSRNTKAISDWCVEFAQTHGLHWYQDSTNNVIISKPASHGFEDAPTVILQGHLDMVCEKNADSPIDFMRDGLQLATDGTDVYAVGTSLGGDDGIAVAMALAILEDDTLAHPPLEALFTVDEEIGMDGAQALDCSQLQGRTLINLDSEEEGILTVSCAGGLRADCILKTTTEAADGRIGVQLIVNGLLGGHSGVEIDKGRANANKLMARVLYTLQKQADIRLISLEGGRADNVIPSVCTATLAVNASDIATLQSTTADLMAVLKNEYRATDPGICLQFSPLDVVPEMLTSESSHTVIGLLLAYPNGIRAMSAEVPGLVQTSLNLGILRLDGDTLKAGFSIRSSVTSQKNAVLDRLVNITTLMGGLVETYGDYPGWEYRPESRLRDIMCEVWQQQTGKAMKVEAIHAGLECGLFNGKMPGLDCVSLGPSMRDIHSAKERLNIASVERTYALVCKTLSCLK